MSTTMLSGVPLLGALCVAAGLVSQKQVEICLQLQRTTYPGTPIGQILVREGYCSAPDMARMVARQQAFRRAFCLAIEQSGALTIVAEPDSTSASDTLQSSLTPELGAFAEAEFDTSPIFGARR